jgi:hypothetical protein
MPNEVFANGMELACKAGEGKSICAFPDVCFTPPENPATPPGVPTPYPNTGMASDTTDGSKTVQISSREVMLKNKSYFKTSAGDEAGCAAKKGAVTSVNRGKVYFSAWSMDVKFEGENVVRNLDLTTHNHASYPANSPTWPFLDSAAFNGSGDCADVASNVNQHCSAAASQTQSGAIRRKQSMASMCDNPDCRQAMRCVVSPHSPNNCCPDANQKQPTPHHIVPKSQFKEPGESGPSIPLASGGTYRPSKAPCVCVDGESHSEGKHGEIHSKTNKKTRQALGVESKKRIPADRRWTVREAETIGAEAVQEATPHCPKECIEAQTRMAHAGMGIKEDDKIRPTTAGGEESDDGLPDMT